MRMTSMLNRRPPVSTCGSRWRFADRDLVLQAPIYIRGASARKALPVANATVVVNARRIQYMAVEYWDRELPATLAVLSRELGVSRREILAFLRAQHDLHCSTNSGRRYLDASTATAVREHFGS